MAFFMAPASVPRLERGRLPRRIRLLEVYFRFLLPTRPFLRLQQMLTTLGALLLGAGACAASRKHAAK
jgi:hypothetical protein